MHALRHFFQCGAWQDHAELDGSSSLFARYGFAPVYFVKHEVTVMHFIQSHFSFRPRESKEVAEWFGVSPADVTPAGGSRLDVTTARENLHDREFFNGTPYTYQRRQWWDAHPGRFA